MANELSVLEGAFSLELSESAAPMSRDEARAAVSLMRQSETFQKKILLALHEREGYSALGYKTWKEFAEREFGVSEGYFYRLLDAARVELNLSSAGVVTCQLASNLPESHARELAKLTPQMQIEVYQEAVEAAPMMAYRGKESHENGKVTASLIKKIAAQKMGAAEKPEPHRRSDPLENEMRKAQEQGTTVKSFAPPVDAERPAIKLFDVDPENIADRSEPFDFEGVLLDIETLAAWLKAKQIPAGTQTRIIHNVMASCDSAARWLEREARK